MRLSIIILLIISLSLVLTSYSQSIDIVQETLTLSYEGYAEPIIKVSIVDRKGKTTTTITRLGFLERAISLDRRLDLLDTESIHKVILDEYEFGILLSKKKAYNNLTWTQFTQEEYENFISSTKLINILNEYLEGRKMIEKAKKDLTSELWFSDKLTDSFDFQDLNKDEELMTLRYLWENGIVVMEYHNVQYKVANFTKFKIFMEERKAL